jgi:N-acetylglutamate synthase-like GNAT family acetyltransferase
MHALEARAVSFGLTNLFLFTGEADHFYHQLGWRTIGRSEDQGAPAAVMEKLIDR